MGPTLQEVADKASILPGNALGSTTIPVFPFSDKLAKVGEGSSQVSWTAWLGDVANAAYSIVNPLTSVMPTAKEVAVNASRNTVALVKSAESRVIGAATGLGTAVTETLGGVRDTVKYLAWALVAFAVIYIVAVFIVPAMAASRGK